jgi:hypothetical protein
MMKIYVNEDEILLVGEDKEDFGELDKLLNKDTLIFSDAAFSPRSHQVRYKREK